MAAGAACHEHRRAACGRYFIRYGSQSKKCARFSCALCRGPVLKILLYAFLAARLALLAGGINRGAPNEQHDRDQ